MLKTTMTSIEKHRHWKLLRRPTTQNGSVEACLSAFSIGKKARMARARLNLIRFVCPLAVCIVHADSALADIDRSCTDYMNFPNSELVLQSAHDVRGVADGSIEFEPGKFVDEIAATPSLQDDPLYFLVDAFKSLLLGQPYVAMAHAERASFAIDASRVCNSEVLLALVAAVRLQALKTLVTNTDELGFYDLTLNTIRFRRQLPLAASDFLQAVCWISIMNSDFHQDDSHNCR